jgi:hypothetical protein
MWLNDLKPDDSWMGVWSAVSHCDKCHALMRSSPCPVCGDTIDSSPKRVVINGVERTMPHLTQGAIALVNLRPIAVHAARMGTSPSGNGFLWEHAGREATVATASNSYIVLDAL